MGGLSCHPSSDTGLTEPCVPRGSTVTAGAQGQWLSSLTTLSGVPLSECTRLLSGESRGGQGAARRAAMGR